MNKWTDIHIKRPTYIKKIYSLEFKWTNNTLNKPLPYANNGHPSHAFRSIQRILNRIHKR